MVFLRTLYKYPSLIGPFWEPFIKKPFFHWSFLRTFYKYPSLIGLFWEPFLRTLYKTLRIHWLFIKVLYFPFSLSSLLYIIGIGFSIIKILFLSCFLFCLSENLLCNSLFFEFFYRFSLHPLNIYNATPKGVPQHVKGQPLPTKRSAFGKSIQMFIGV